MYRLIESLDPEYVKGRAFTVSWYDLSQAKNIRDLKSDLVGKLICFNGTVTKTSEVRPELIYGAFQCDQCGTLINNVEQQFRYTEPKRCANSTCTNAFRYTLDENGSFFGDWQKLRVQEPTREMSSGVLPRSLDVIVRGEKVDIAQPGDDVTFVGTLLAVPYGYSMARPGEKYQLTKSRGNFTSKGAGTMQGITGVKSFGNQDLNYRFIFLACNIIKKDSWMSRAEDAEEEEEMGAQEREMIDSMIKLPDIFERLAGLIAPNIWGSMDIKKGILLMIFGGVTKFSSDGMKMRGDINLAIVGDPSTAKSQFLKFVHTHLPRCVYANGKGTTAAGLTAAVTRDAETNEFGIEAGALIMADNGICCIDEFDKIDEQDTSAIHEAMEQQTISITKAGIQATLNSRTAILAALNPRYGRYDKSKSLKNNINMAPPLMSRFDLIFVVTDDCNEVRDFGVAKHILLNHKQYAKNHIDYGEDRDMMDEGLPIKEEGEESNDLKLNVNNLLRYLKTARLLEPRLLEESAKELLEYYIRIREYNNVSLNNSYNITVRQLESLIRLSEAIARVHMKEVVTVDHVHEAGRLLKGSLFQSRQDDILVEKTEHELIERNEKIEEEGNLNETKIENERATPAENQMGAPIEEEEPTQEPKKKRKKISISNVQYQEISKEVITILKSNTEGVHLSLLIQQTAIFLRSTANTTMEEDHKKNVIKAIIKRMLRVDKKLIMLSAQNNPDPKLGINP